MKLKMLLVMCLLSNYAFADVYVIYDKATEEIYSLSDNDDAVCPEDKEKTMLNGSLASLDLTYPYQWYKLSGGQLKLNAKRLEEESVKEEKAREAYEREQKIQTKMREIAEQALIESGELEVQ